MRFATFSTAYAKAIGSCNGSSGGRYRGGAKEAGCKTIDREADPRGGKGAQAMRGGKEGMREAVRDGGILLLPLKMLGFGAEQ